MNQQLTKRKMRRMSKIPETIKYRNKVMAKKRMMGQTYEQQTGQLGQAQKMSNPCVSIACAKSSQHFRNEIDLETRKQIFKDFLKMTWKENKAFICNLIGEVPIKSRHHKSGEKERNHSFIYYIPTASGRKRVCKNFFSNNFDIDVRTVHRWRDQGFCSPEDKNESRKITKASTRKVLEHATRLTLNLSKSFLPKIPKQPLHYCRKNSDKVFLEALFDSKQQHYKIYKEYCGEKKAQTVSQSHFITILNSNSLQYLFCGRIYVTPVWRMKLVT
jgi:hypothetical protein